MSQTGQLAVPKTVRDEMGIRPSGVLQFFEEGGRLVGERYDGVPFDDEFSVPDIRDGWGHAFER